jgi:hypothetical protein
MKQVLQHVQSLRYIAPTELAEDALRLILKFCSPEIKNVDHFQASEIETLSRILNSAEITLNNQRFWNRVRLALRGNLGGIVDLALEHYADAPDSYEYITWKAFDTTIDMKGTTVMKALDDSDKVDASESDTGSTELLAEISNLEVRMIAYFEVVQDLISGRRTVEARDMLDNQITQDDIRLILYYLTKATNFWDERENWKKYESAILFYLLNVNGKEEAYSATQLYIYLTQTTQVVGLLNLTLLVEIAMSEKDSLWLEGVFQALNEHGIYREHIDLLREEKKYTPGHPEAVAQMLSVFIIQLNAQRKNLVNPIDVDDATAVKLRIMFKHIYFTVEELIGFRAAFEKLFSAETYPQSLKVIRTFIPYADEASLDMDGLGEIEL